MGKQLGLKTSNAPVPDESSLLVLQFNIFEWGLKKDLSDFEKTEDGEERLLMYKPCIFCEKKSKYKITVLSSFEREW